MTHHLETIYLQFSHIESTIEAFEEYVKRHDNFIPDHKKKNVDTFFEHAKTNVTHILCVIKAIAPKLYGMHEKKVAEAANKKYDKIDGVQPRNDFWVMYREYEIILDYSYQLLSTILEE